MGNPVKKPFLFAVLAAIFYAVSVPVSKILLAEISPVLLAALLYLGAGAGMFILGLLRKKTDPSKREAGLSKSDLPFVIGMILLDVAAPILLMTGLAKATAQNASLLNSFEIVATTLIAMIVFREHIGKKLWIAIGLITVASIILSVTDLSGLSFSSGSLLILAACVCWGFENNCTRMMSIKDPLQITVIKGLGSGLGALAIAIGLSRAAASLRVVVIALLLGFVAYGLSIFFYVNAQRFLGAAKTSAVCAISPFIGVFLSFLIFREKPGLNFLAALLFVAAGTCLIIMDKHRHSHTHLPVAHNHLHSHDDFHHDHDHPGGQAPSGMHSHEHTHDRTSHSHEHNEDLHHIHSHPHS